MSAAVPAYRELPLLGDLGVRHAWEVWGDGDRLGTLNRLTDEVCLRALRVPRTGTRIPLSLPLGEPAPPLYGRTPLGHRVFARNKSMIEDELAFDTQASSQWDALRHFAAREHGFYGGVREWDSADADALGIHNLARHGLVTRGVLLDVAAAAADLGLPADPLVEHALTADDLAAVADRQGSAFAPGDVLLVRTGWWAAHVAEPHRSAGAMPTGIGLRADDAMAEFLWDGGFAAVAADNPAVESLPGDPAVGSLHRRVLAGLGMPLGELWDLDVLVAACRESGRYECLLVSVPLNVPGGVASPANAVAVL